MKRNGISAAVAFALAGAIAYIPPALAQSAPAQKPQQREAIYGYQMMTDAERNEYREKMPNAKTAQERQALRDEHRGTMEARMKERGVEPGQMRGHGAGPYGPGGGQGSGPGPGAGRGPAAGMGPGSGMGPGGPQGPGKGSGLGNAPGTGTGGGPGRVIIPGSELMTSRERDFYHFPN